METIKNYLENMFLNIPYTEEVIKAKKELYQMMEDKYNELKTEGKSENEAIGIVISEFGNLDEIAEELGIKESIQIQTEQNTDGMQLTYESAKAYIEAKTSESIRVAIGVMLCICSPIGAIVTSNQFDSSSSAIGITMLFSFIAIAVGFFIYNAISMGEYSEIKNSKIILDFETIQRLKEQQAEFRPIYALFVTVGVILCVFSVVPASVAGSLFDELSQLLRIGEALMFFLIGIGVMLIIMGSMKYKAYSAFLKDKRTYSHKEKNLSSIGMTIMSVFWPSILCLYLIWSFLTYDWGITWIIWPIAAVFQRIVANVFRVK